MLGVRRSGALLSLHAARCSSAAFVFSPENFVDPKLPAGLEQIDVPLRVATDESLKAFGRLIHSSDEVTTQLGNFEIKPWPVGLIEQTDEKHMLQSLSRNEREKISTATVTNCNKQ